MLQGFFECEVLMDLQSCGKAETRDHRSSGSVKTGRNTGEIHEEIMISAEKSPHSEGISVFVKSPSELNPQYIHLLSVSNALCEAFATL